MIKHSFNVIKHAVHHLNSGHALVITFDQPCMPWPNKFSGHSQMSTAKLSTSADMFEGLHIEIAALKTMGDWLWGSSWVQMLVQADIALPGIADSFLQAAHVVHTRRVHQVTVIALYVLMHCAYDHYCTTRFIDILKMVWSETKNLPTFLILGNCYKAKNYAFLSLCDLYVLHLSQCTLMH